MAVITPAPRIGKFAGGAMPARPTRKPVRKASKSSKQKTANQPFAPGLINRPT